MTNKPNQHMGWEFREFGHPTWDMPHTRAENEVP
jgi:hypothetical protein